MPQLPPLPRKPSARPEDAAGRSYRAVERVTRWPVGTVYAGEILPGGAPCSILFPDLVAGEVEAFMHDMADEVARNRLLVGLPVDGFVHVGQTIDRRPFLVLPPATANHLEARIESQGPLAPLATLQVCVLLADALTRMHYRVRFLGELPPWTVLLPSDRSEELRMIDLGVTRGLFSRSVAPPTASQHFASPRVRAGGEPEAADDIYALGALLFFTLTGQTPPPRSPPYASRRRPLGLFGSFLDGLLVQSLTPEAAPLRLPDMRMMARALRGLRDLHRLSRDAQRAVLMLRTEGRGARPPPVPGAEAMPHSALGFVESDGPSFLTQAELESIEHLSVAEMDED